MEEMEAGQVRLVFGLTGQAGDVSLDLVTKDEVMRKF